MLGWDGMKRVRRARETQEPETGLDRVRGKGGREPEDLGGREVRSGRATRKPTPLPPRLRFLLGIPWIAGLAGAWIAG